MKTKEQIEKFLSKTPRYRLVVARDENVIDGISWIDLGYEAAMLMELNRDIDRDGWYILGDELVQIVGNAICELDGMGKVVGIKNAGVLFDGNLMLNPAMFISILAQKTLLVLKWDGEIMNERLHLMKAGSPHYIDLSGINYIVL